MTELCVLQKPNMILSFEWGKMLSKFWPKSNFNQHLGPLKRLTKIIILLTFCNMQNVIIISTNVTIMLAFCPTQKGVMLPVPSDFAALHPRHQTAVCNWFRNQKQMPNAATAKSREKHNKHKISTLHFSHFLSASGLESAIEVDWHFENYCLATSDHRCRIPREHHGSIWFRTRTESSFPIGSFPAGWFASSLCLKLSVQKRMSHSLRTDWRASLHSQAI